MKLQEQFRRNWQEQYPDIQPGQCHLLLALSGGVDSVVLADLVFNSGFSFSIAHCNFQLRGEESDRDEGFTRSLAEKYGVPVHVRRFDTQAYAGQERLGIQEAARALRYNWFRELMAMDIAAGKPVYLMTAHHADDNIETVLFNIFRGTGLAGLHGILPRQGRVLRPLLFAFRHDILDHAASAGLRWVEDSSNESTRYTRNYIRHEILPVLKQVFPAVAGNLVTGIQRWGEAGELYQQAVAMHKKRLCEVRGDEVHIPVLKLRQAAPLKTIVYEIIRDFGFSSAQADEVTGLLESESGRYVASSTHRVIRNRNWLIIAPLQSDHPLHILVEKGQRKIVFPGGELLVEETAGLQPPGAASIALLDGARVKFPLLLRRWRQGDYFYPLGMNKKKKISRFLVDQKVSLTEKEKVWVLESDKKILWVLGYRIDDRFKITPSSKNAVKFTLRTG